MVGFLLRLHAPVEPGFEIVLQIGREALQRIVAVRRAVPGILLVGPEVIAIGKLLLSAIPSGPASPRRLVRIIHSGWNQVQKRSRVPFFLGMRGIERIEGAERTVSRAAIALDVES